MVINTFKREPWKQPISSHFSRKISKIPWVFWIKFNPWKSWPAFSRFASYKAVAMLIHRSCLLGGDRAWCHHRTAPPLPTRMLPSLHHRWYCPPDSGTAWKARQSIALSGEVIPCFFPLIRCQSWLAIANTSGNREGSPGSFLLNRICGGDANIVTAVVIWAMVQISRLIQSTREKGVIVPPWTRHLHALT